MTKSEIFNAVVNVENSAERLQMLDELCADESQLKREILELLESLPQGKSTSPFLFETQLSNGATLDDPAGYSTGTIIGPYEIIRQIGHGGMGSVYLAKQTQPVVREVALKVVRSGLDSNDVIARFENERQTLALMEHPNIARILDAGTTDNGRPYFVMEFVQGLRITDYCNRHRLDINQRLALFADVCSGIHHAHQKGIIHRDLKPSNILVMEVDGRPVPKVIDFGLAKALENPLKLTQKSLYQGFRQIVGTLRYMSPEQASLSTVDVDTRSDIYSLGVVLYELLTGSTPLESRSLSNRAVLALLASLQYRDPARPSSRLTQSAETVVSTIADQRRTDSSRLKRLLAQDLDWIVMKALEKDRARRYESVSGFADDVQRYLENEPVVARPPSAKYRIGKFVKKNRAAVIVAGLLTVSLLAGVIGTTWGQVLAERRAEGERLAREQAQKRLEQIETNNEILSRIFSDLNLRSFRAGEEPLEAILAKRLVDAAGKLRAESIGDPLVVARMQIQLGYSLVHLGFAKDAIPLFEQSLETYRKIKGDTHRATLVATRALAGAYMSVDDGAQALPMWEKLYETCKSELGEDDVETIGVMAGLANAYTRDEQYEKALRLLQKTLQYRTENLGEDHPGTLQNMSSLAGTYLYLDDFESAMTLFEKAWEISRQKGGPDHYDTLSRMNGLAHALEYAGEIPRSHEMLKETFRLRKAKLGKSHPNTLRSAFSLAESYVAVGDPDASIELTEKTLPLAETKLGPNHYDTLSANNTLAAAYFLKDDRQKAISKIDETIALQRQHLGNDRISTQHSVASLGYFYRKAGQPDEAIPPLVEAVASSEKYFKLIWAVPQLLKAYWEAGRHEEFRSTFERQLNAARERYANHSLKLARFLWQLAPALMVAEDHATAEKLLQESLSIFMTASCEHWDVLDARLLLVEALLSQEKFDEADEMMPAIREQVERYESNLRCIRDSKHEKTMKRIAAQYGAAGRDVQAIIWQGFVIE